MSEQAIRAVRPQGTSDHSTVAPAAFETAVLLADDSDAGVGAPISVLTVVAGLPLLVRAVLTLQRSGLQRVIILIGDEEEAYRETLLRYSGIAISVRWMPTREFLPYDVRSWQALAAEIGSFLLIDVRLLFSPELIDTICKEARHDDMVAVACKPEEAGFGSAVTTTPSKVYMLSVPAQLLSSQGYGGRSAPSTIGANVRNRDATAFDCLLAAGAEAGGIRFILVPPAGCCPIRDQADVSVAEQRLLRSLKTDFEGLVDTYLNRPLSRRLSRLFLRIGFSPNVITSVSVAIGLVAAAIIAGGSYVSGVLGALLFQFSSIVDCCDGEVARVTFAESRLGALLDLIGDNLAHLAIFAGVAWSVYLQGPVLTWMSPVVPLVLGAAAMLANGLALWLVMRAKRLRDAGRLGSVTRTAYVDLILRKVASRDFSIVLVAFAVFDWLELFLWLAALGSNVFWVMLAWTTRPAVLTPTSPASSAAYSAREPRA